MLSILPVSDTALSDDSYNGDLAWILEKLCWRARVEHALILRLSRPAGDRRVLAACPATLEPDAALLDSLQHATLSPRIAPATDTPVQELQHDGAPVMFMPFVLDAGTAIVVAVQRTRGPFGLVQRRVMRRVHGVFERYLRLWWMHRCERLRAAALLRAIDLSDLGVVLLDRRGRLVSANPFARTLLEREEGVRLVAGMLAAEHADEALSLQSALQYAILQNARGTAPGPDGVSPMAAMRRPEKRQLIVTAVAVEQRALDDGDVAAVVYLVDPDCDLTRRLAPACKLHGLSASEARLVRCLVGGATLLEAAESLNVRPETARGYLKQVFAKTGTNRQVDLLKLMIASVSRVGVGTDLSLL